jgi:hypothetical protein
MIEEWLDVRGFDGAYQVSNYGRIRSMPRISANGKQLCGKILTQGIVTPKSGYRYCAVTIRRDNENHRFRVARLVASHFLGDSELEVFHKDRDATNNRVDNLGYSDRSSWTKDQYTRSIRIPYWRNKRGSATPFNLPRVLVSCEKPWFGHWAPSTVSAAEAIGVRPQNITMALSRAGKVRGFRVYGERR